MKIDWIKRCIWVYFQLTVFNMNWGKVPYQFPILKWGRFTHKWYVCQILKNAYNNEFQYISYDIAFLEWHILKLEHSCYVYVKVMIIPSFIFLLQTYFAEGGQEKANQTKFLACRQYNSKVIFLTLLTLKFTYHMSPPIFYNDISADFKRWVKEIA